jgi:hypothetical protein
LFLSILDGERILRTLQDTCKARVPWHTHTHTLTPHKKAREQRILVRSQCVHTR